LTELPTYKIDKKPVNGSKSDTDGGRHKVASSANKFNGSRFYMVAPFVR
jgi:hypothetical protein